MERIITDHQRVRETSRFFQQVYAWMCGGLIISWLTAYLVATTSAIYELIFSNNIIIIALIIIELGLVISLAGWIKKMAVSTATFLFLLYCFTTGLTLSVIFLVYTATSIVSVFFITAGMFAAISLYGFFTKQDLSGMGRILIMGLFGIIIASLINMFMRSAAADYVISIIAVLIFTGLTAYDTQRLKAMNIIGNEWTDEGRKESIIGALTLYLDFINLFLRLLSLFGKRR